MISISRWALVAVFGALLLGCGGNDSNTSVDHKSGTIYGFTGALATGGSIHQSGDQTVGEGALFFENGVPERDGDRDISITRYTNLKWKYAENDDDLEDDLTVDFMRFNTTLRYLNNTLEPIDFILNQDTQTYGYNVTVSNRTDGSVVWDLEEMLNWCSTLADRIHADYPDIKTLYGKDIGFESTVDYSEPSSLAAAEDWFSTEDTRLSNCPLIGYVDRWIGRETKDADTTSIQEAVLEVYAEYQQDLDDADCDTDSESETCVELVVPTFSDLADAILIGSDINPALDGVTDDVVFDVEITLSMNEFKPSGPYEFTVTVETEALELED